MNDLNRAPAFFLFCLLSFCSLLSPAQQTQIYVDRDAEFRRGLDLFDKQKYSAAQEAFRNVAAGRDHNDFVRIDAEYYNAVCAMELFNKDAEVLLKQFLADHPESPKVRRVHFHLGRYNYRKKDFKEALDWFAKVDMRDLEPEELPEFFFKRGYSFFEREQLDSAKRDFYEIKDVDTKYTAPANYYYSHIAYLEGNYETALQGFLRLVKNEAFGPVVPYYIAQIYYLQGKYDEVIVYAPALLDSAKAKRAGEIARIIGASYYRTSRYGEAIPYYERYRYSGTGMSRGDLYEMGYSYYKTGKCAEAITLLQDAIAGMADTLAQNAWYHLGDCYVKTGNKPAARNAFGKAAELKFDKGMREDALFSYARLSYELSYSPFNEAIIALQQYINEYPNSARKDEAYSFLVNVYLSTKNYKDALRSIEQIKNIGPALQPAYQQVAYNRAVELFNSRDYDGALAHFDKSLQYPVNRKLTAYAHYWKGETYYAKADANNFSKALYAKSVDSYKAFLNAPGAANLPDFNNANYNIGYAFFQQGEYESGATWFRKYVTNRTDEKPERVADAYLRMADAYYSIRPKPDYINAAEFYGEAVKMNLTEGRDYALYQQAMALGRIGKKEEKANILKRMLSDHPKSQYLAVARYQQARTYHDLKRYEEALDAYRELLNDPAPASNTYDFVCLMQMGLIYQTNLNDMDKALESYLAALKLSAGQDREQQATALQQCKEIYIARGQIEEWEALKSQYNYSESGYSLDSTAFVSMLNVYKEGQGDCAALISQASRYIQRFPNGFHLTEVHYMKAECEFKNNDVANALTSYNYIIAKPANKFTETALQRSSYIYYKQLDWTNAARVLEQLEKVATTAANRQDAQVNLLRVNIFLNRFDTAAAYAEKVLMISKLPAEVYVQAHYAKGKSAFNRQDYALALSEFNQVVKAGMKNEVEAESKYNTLYIGYVKKDYKKTETALFKYISDYGGFPQWKGKGFLLLADNYLALKDTFQAKYLLKSYAESGEVPELKQQAQEKLAELEALENARRAGKKEEELLVPIDENGTERDKRLFENETPKEGGGQ